MTIRLDAVSVKGLRVTHFEQIMCAVMDREDSGIYSGNKEQYYKRHKEIKVWLNNLIEMAANPDYRIPVK